MAIERRDIGTVNGARQARLVATDDLIFMSGIHPDSTAGDARAQTREALGHVDAALRDVGETQASILMVHVWLKDMRFFGAMNAAWNEWADPNDPPARTCVSGELFRPDLLVEVVVTACRTRGQS